MARYRKINPRIWRDENFSPLSKDEKLIALYVLSGDQTTPLGIFSFSPAKCAEDLDISPQTFDRSFVKVLRVFRWKFDRKRKVLYLPTWWKYNTPENPNVLKSFAPFLHDLPQTYLYKQFATNLDYLPESFHKSFRERFPESLPNSFKASGKASPKASPQPPRDRESKTESKSNTERSIKRKQEEERGGSPLPSPPGELSKKNSKNKDPSAFVDKLVEKFNADWKQPWEWWRSRLQLIQRRTWEDVLLTDRDLLLLVNGQNTGKGKFKGFEAPDILWLAIAYTKRKPKKAFPYLRVIAKDQDSVHRLQKLASAMTDNDFG